MKLDSRIGTRSVAVSTIGRRIPINRFDDANEQMQRFRSVRTLQKFSSVQGQVQNHLNLERHLVARQVYKQRRLIALAEWRALAAWLLLAGQVRRVVRKRRPLV
jgi:hypothetical protein